MDNELLQEFDRYLAHLGAGLGHADRQAGLRGYCTGLMAPLARKSVEPMAAHLAPQATRARHQSLHHFVAESAWSDEEMGLGHFEGRGWRGFHHHASLRARKNPARHAGGGQSAVLGHCVCGHLLALFGDQIPPIGWAGMELIVGRGIVATVLRARGAGRGTLTQWGPSLTQWGQSV